MRPDTATAEINDKCYQRWHQVLQEGLVPMAVRALNLLEKTAATAGDEVTDDEEDAYLATMEGMDEEIRVMAILARAAALDDVPFRHEGKGCANETKCTASGDGDGMEHIDDMMKCTAMLLFHIVLAASTPGSSSSESTRENNISDTTKNETTETTVAGYDGRVRHVMKLACVDVLTRAIVESVESFDNNNVSIATDEEDQSTGLYDVDQYSLWNIANVKRFLDQTDLGKDAIFGAPFKPSGTSEGAGGKKLSGAGEEETNRGKEQRKRLPRPDVDEQTVTSEDTSKQSQSNGNDQVSTPGEMPSKTVESIGSIDSSDDSSSSLEVQVVEKMNDAEMEFIKSSIPKQGDDDVDDMERSNQSKGEHSNEEPDSTKLDAHDGCGGSVGNRRSDEERGEGGWTGPRQSEVVKELRARRRFNAKFLAARKFELIERAVAIDVVRFLMAEEREKKLRENERRLWARKNKGDGNPSSLSKKGGDGDARESKNEESATVDDGDSSSDENGDASSELIANAGYQYFTASRIRQIKRGAKIAGAGLALGTVFAITGGLAAPALAAGIGGVAALTGASTASSAALLAVLATFKAGAALFGVGGGGLAAYKMKKRTAGLSQFEIRRENIEQYMYAGASEEKMKKGIESMLPQLHTTIVVSGWLRHNDVADFQLAWGIQPTCKYEDEYNHDTRIRQMKRFYAIYNPPLVYLCESFMKTLQRRLKKDFNWDRIWSSLEQKYGTNPDHMLPIDRPHENEVFLSYEEKAMVDGVLNDAKITNLRKRFGPGDGIDFNLDDEISELLASVSPEKVPMKNTVQSKAELDLDTMEHELITMQSDQSVGGSDCSNQMDHKADRKKRDAIVKEIEMSNLSIRSYDDGDPATPEISPITRERKDKGLSDDESNHQEGGSESPKVAGSDSACKQGTQGPPVKNEEIVPEEYEDERCPIVWDWKRLYGTADIHTVTWESQMLSSLCHIVENMALEVSSQATKVALQFSVIGAIVSAVAIPSALITASKLIDDPYQIVVIRADEAGKELAKCLLQSDERRPVSLVGFSFGARVVYSCLRELARQQDIWEESRVTKPEENKSGRSFLSKKSKDERRFEYGREPASLVGDVVFIGLPRAIDKKVLTSCRRVTGGRLVNCYTRNDWLLSLMFVARGGTPCGTKAIKDVPGVENYDVTHLVESHTKYGDAIPNIMQHIRFSEP